MRRPDPDAIDGFGLAIVPPSRAVGDRLRRAGPERVGPVSLPSVAGRFTTNRTRRAPTGSIVGCSS
jgi:hypothetical protein